MRNLLSMLAAMIIAVGSLATTAEGAPIAGQSAVTQSATELGSIEKTAFIWGGRTYCWYDSGWRGPGWYWCGFAWRRGFGWGGGFGWRGWRWHGGRYWGRGAHWHGGGVVVAGMAGHRGGWHRGGGWHGGGHRGGWHGGRTSRRLAWWRTPGWWTSRRRGTQGWRRSSPVIGPLFSLEYSCRRDSCRHFFMSRSFDSEQKLKLISVLPFDLSTRALWFATPARGTLLCMTLAIYRSSSFLPR